MLEKHLERWCREEVKKAGGLFYKWTSPGQSGVPDRILILRGTVVFVELKRVGGRLTEHQAFVIGKLRAHGARVEVVSSKDDLRDLLASIA